MRILYLLAGLLIVVAADTWLSDGQIARALVGVAHEFGRGAKHEIAGLVQDITP